jgi:hypothetical protein
MTTREVGKLQPRADSFSLYCNWVANKVLPQILSSTLLNSRLRVIKQPGTVEENKRKFIQEKSIKFSLENKTPIVAKRKIKTSESPIKKLIQTHKNQ